MLQDFEAGGVDGIETFFTTPPQGRRVRIDDDITVVLRRHHTREALVVATVVPSLGPIEIDASTS